MSVEPIMDFSDSMRGLGPLWELIKEIEPVFVSIGADSKGRGLPEPSAKKILGLVERLSEFTEVRIKDNMKRLLGGK